MGRQRQFALVLLCGTVTFAGWGAAGTGRFDPADVGHTATLPWNRVPTRDAATRDADAASIGMATPPARASLVAAVSSHLKRSEPAIAAAPAADAATVDPATRETGFDLAGASAAEAPLIESDAHP